MGKWIIGFVTIEFLFLLAWVMGVDRNQRRQRELERRRQDTGGCGQDDAGRAWPPARMTSGAYRTILFDELEATAEILHVGIEALKTDAGVSLAGLREFRDGLAAQVYAMRKCKAAGEAANDRAAGAWNDNGGLWMLDKGEAPR